MKIILSLIFFLFFDIASPLYSQAIKGVVSKDRNSWKLLRGGKPYYINGAGGQTNLDLIVPEITDKKAGGDLEEKPEALKGNITLLKDLSQVEIKTHEKLGAYRLFVYATDGKSITYANWHFFV